MFVAYLCPSCGTLYKSFRDSEVPPTGAQDYFPGRCFHPQENGRGFYKELRRVAVTFIPDSFELGGQPEYKSGEAKAIQVAA